MYSLLNTMSYMINNRDAVPIAAVFSVASNLSSDTVYQNPLMSAFWTATWGTIVGSLIETMAFPKVRPIIAAGLYAIAAYKTSSRAIGWLSSCSQRVQTKSENTSSDGNVSVSGSHFTDNIHNIC
jgi:hypothetical protein